MSSCLFCPFQNRIGRIENLFYLSNLEFLTLSGNIIKVVEELTDLYKLKFLDLSDNRIADINSGEFVMKQLLY